MGEWPASDEIDAREDAALHMEAWLLGVLMLICGLLAVI
jgi:hypothetical protein